MKRAASVALIGVSGFALLAGLWMNVPAWHRLDAAGLNWIHAQTPDALIPWAETITHLGGLPITIPLALALAGFLWRRGRRPVAIIWGAGFLGDRSCFWA